MPDKSSHPDRRVFVKNTSAVLAGGTVLATGIKRATAAALGDREIKIALIGCGGRGTAAALQALSTEGKVKLWAMADAFGPCIEASLDTLKGQARKAWGSEAEQKLSERLDVPAERQFAGLDAYQKAIDSGVDVVVHASPPGFRPIHVEAAINAGKHVFTEKPLAVDAPGVRRILAAKKVAEEKGLCVGVGLQRHHDPAYQETIKRLQEGAIGDILLTRVYWNGGPLWVRTRTDFVRKYGHDPTEMEYQVNNWYYFNWLCGDHIVEQHIHNLDVSNWVKDSHPVVARGMGGRQRRTSREFGQIFDHHAVEFTYPDGATMLSECRQMDGCWNQVAEYATGSKGTVNISGAMIQSPEGDWRYSGPRVDPYQQEHDDLFAAIRAGKPYNELEYGAHSTMTAIMGRMATYSGKQIEWDEALNSDHDLSPTNYDFASEPPVLPDSTGDYPVPVPGKTEVV